MVGAVAWYGQSQGCGRCGGYESRHVARPTLSHSSLQDCTSGTGRLYACVGVDRCGGWTLEGR